MILERFSQLYHQDYLLENTIAMRQRWEPGDSFVMRHPRPTHALFLILAGEALCEQTGTDPIKFPEHSVACMPAGSQYTWRFSSDRITRVLLFEFTLQSLHYGTDENKRFAVLEEKIDCRGPREEISFPTLVFPVIQAATPSQVNLFENVVAEFGRPTAAPAAIRAASYLILNAVAEEDYFQEHYMRGEISQISAAIYYLENDPVQDKSMEELAQMCHVSTRYFEKLFLCYAGVTPATFRLNRKIQKACVLLRSKAMSVEQIATELGFYDSAYFCRIFKKKTGLTPGQYRRKRMPEEI